jgi:hypothetical protein
VKEVSIKDCKFSRLSVKYSMCKIFLKSFVALLCKTVIKEQLFKVSRLAVRERVSDTLNATLLRGGKEKLEDYVVV